jgi:hypothetical protein
MTVKDELTGATAPPVTHTIVVASATPVASLPVVSTTPAPVAAASTVVVMPQNSTFTAGETVFNQTTGEVTFNETVGDPGTFSWLLTFKNGKFGVFTASAKKCKAGQVRLGGRCRPSKIVFAKGSRVVAAPGTVAFRIKPSRSGLKALKNALRQKKGLVVTATFTFQSARSGLPASRTQTITVKLKKR